MNRISLSIEVLLFMLIVNNVVGQGTAIPFAENFTERYSECAAIIFNDKMLVETYSPDAKCSLIDSLNGTVSLSTVLLSEEKAEVKTAIPFRWAIKNRKTGTFYSVDSGIKLKIELRDILKHCGMDDSIIIMTVDPNYSLPHNEILIKRGC